MESEEEEEVTTPRGKPNLYWAKVRQREIQHQQREQQKEQRLDPDTFTSGFRAVKNKAGRGGAAYVKPEDTIGDTELCWCGLPFDHDWPGKASGRKHPKGTEMPTDTAITRREIRAYHADLQEVIIQAVNTYGCKHRVANNSVMLYPPDGSRPFTVYARNSDRQISAARKWFVSHVLMLDEDGTPQNPLIKDGTIVVADFERRAHREVDERSIRELAERVNSPEHTPPPKQKVSDGPIRKQVEAPPPPQYDVDEHGQRAPAGEPGSVSEPDDDGWAPHEYKGRKSPYFESRQKPDGTYEYRCVACRAEGTEWYTTNARALGGHARINHTDTTSLYAKETRAKATKTTQETKARKRRTELLERIAAEFGIQVDNREQGQEITDLRKQVKDLTQRAEHAERLAAEAGARAEEVEAKLALIREATGL